MMTGIMAVEMGLSLTGQSFLTQPEDSYQQISILIGWDADRQMLNMLHNQDDLDAIGRSLRGVGSVISCYVEAHQAVRQVVVP